MDAFQPVLHTSEPWFDFPHFTQRFSLNRFSFVAGKTCSVDRGLSLLKDFLGVVLVLELLVLALGRFFEVTVVSAIVLV